MSEEKQNKMDSKSEFEKEFEAEGKLTTAGMSERDREIILRGFVGPGVPIIGLDIPYEEAGKLYKESEKDSYREMAQDEVDALLRGLSGGLIEDNDDTTEDEEELRARGMRVSSDYDVLKRYQGRLPRLEIINDRLARIATTALSNLLRLRIELNPISIDMRLFGDMMRSLPVPTWISVIQDKTHNIPMILILDSRLVFAIVEGTMGGGGSQPKIEGRDFTDIEKVILNEVDETLVHCMNKAYSEFIADINIRREKVEVNPQFAAIMKHNAPCVVITFEVELDTSLGSIITIIPMENLERFMPLMNTGDQTIKVLSLSEKEYFELWEERQRREQKDFDKHKNFIPDKKYFQSLLKAGDMTMAQLTRNEHPQTLACILSLIQPEVAAKFLLCLPSGVRSEVIHRISKLQVYQPYFLEVVDRYIRSLSISNPLIVQDKGEVILQAIGEISPKAEEEIRKELKEY